MSGIFPIPTTGSFRLIASSTVGSGGIMEKSFRLYVRFHRPLPSPTNGRAMTRPT